MFIELKDEHFEEEVCFINVKNIYKIFNKNCKVLVLTDKEERYVFKAYNNEIEALEGVKELINRINITSFI